METVRQSFGLLWAALFLQGAPYATLRDATSPVRKGLVILVLLGLAIALAGFIGVTVGWASGPSLDAIQATILEQYQRMPWWQFMEADPAARQMFEQIWDQVWQFVGFLVPTPASAAVSFITKPLGLVIGWLIFGLLAHLAARVLGGVGTLSQTLGATSLAAAPQMLLLLTILPFVAVAGIGVWVLLCRYMALRITHNLSWARAVWAAILPPLILGLLLVILAIAAAALAGPLLAQIIEGGF